MSRYPITLSTEQTQAVKVAAASVPACWRERFYASVQGHLLWPDRDGPISDDDVVQAVNSVHWAMFVGTVDDDD